MNPRYRPRHRPENESFRDERSADLFVAYHIALFPGCGLHPLESDEGLICYAEWCDALDQAGYTISEAMEASRRLHRNPPKDFFARKHLRALLDGCARLRDESWTVSPYVAEVRESDAANRRRIDELAATFGRLAEADREAIRARVRAECPGMDRWPRLFDGCCLAAMESDLEAGRIARPAAAPDPAPDPAPEVRTDPAVVDVATFADADDAADDAAAFDPDAPLEPLPRPRVPSKPELARMFRHDR